jgi:hypothetical protein
MLVGAKERFAIEAEPETIDGEWVLGRFRFWLCGREVGDWSDTTALQHCCRWLRRFEQNPPDCTDPAVARLGAGEVFEMIVDPVFGSPSIANPALQPIPYAYERFHITHLGMSSFDDYVVVLVKNLDGVERCLWRKGAGEILECALAPSEMEAVAREFCDAFEARYVVGTAER